MLLCFSQIDVLVFSEASEPEGESLPVVAAHRGLGHPLDWRTGVLGFRDVLRDPVRRQEVQGMDYFNAYLFHHLHLLDATN